MAGMQVFAHLVAKPVETDIAQGVESPQAVQPEGEDPLIGLAELASWTPGRTFPG